MKRVLAALVMVLTLRLAVVGADVSCVKHDIASNPGAAMNMGRHHHAAANDAAKDKGTHDAPVTPACCRVLGSCTANLLGPATALVASLPVRVDRPSDDTDALHSRVPAPKTPPPKA